MRHGVLGMYLGLKFSEKRIWSDNRALFAHHVYAIKEKESVYACVT